MRTGPGDASVPHPESSSDDSAEEPSPEGSTARCSHTSAASAPRDGIARKPSVCATWPPNAITALPMPLLDVRGQLASFGNSDEQRSQTNKLHRTAIDATNKAQGIAHKPVSQ